MGPRCRRLLRLGPLLRPGPLLFACVLSGLLLLWARTPSLATPSGGSAVSSHDGAFAVRLARGQQEYVDPRGVHVVVGRYMGDAVAAVEPLNLTQEELNANRFAPRPEEGRNGLPVLIPTAQLQRMRHLFHINRYNLLASDRIPLNRTLPDVRKKRCLGKYSEKGLPDTSVIIVFHNEAWSTLLRTVQSVVDRSPPALLHEIILVDDASTRAFLMAPLEEHVARLPARVRVVRTGQRQGLVRARLLGANAARGRILTFLDAHCEVTSGWLEPLVGRIAEERTRVVCPVIDIISDDTFAYVRSFELHWGAFNWELHFRWYTLGGDDIKKRKRDITEPFKTPAMAGGLFAMDRDYFFELGAYDNQMEIWGGENLEMSFRVWQCGGSIEIAPCSHVGHIFRKSSPYSFPGGIAEVLYSNLARVALVWMDEWKEFYFKFSPEAARLRDRQSVRERLALREKLQCKGFKWYLENVWPQHFFPKDDRFFGKIRNRRSDRCLHKPTERGSLNQPTGAAATSPCAVEPLITQMFVVTRGGGDGGGAIMTDESVCLDAAENESLRPKTRVMACSGLPRQRWRYNPRTLALEHVMSGLCLAELNEGVVLDACSEDDRQQWLLEDVPWK